MEQGKGAMRNIKRVFYNSHGEEALYAMIRAAAGEDVELMTLAADDDGERRRKLAEADAVIVAATRFSEELLAAAPRLAFVHHQGVGYHDTVAWQALARRKIPLALTPGGTAESVAEQTLMFMLAVLRMLPYADSELRQGRFHVNAIRPLTRDLSGRSVGILGLGRIGKAVARRLKPFGVKLMYRDILPMPPQLEAELGLEPVSFEDLLVRSEILTLHVPVTPETTKIINRDTLARMRRGAYLINTCRGGVLDEEALVGALAKGQLAGAALDVFDPEPPPPDHALYRFRNVVLTPHIAAGTRDAFMAKMAFVFANLERFWRGEPVENLVDLTP
jgi:phosphoglycerate dehydrogenase-like enzyme